MKLKTYIKSALILVLFHLIFSIKAQTAYSTSFNSGHGWTLNSFNNLNTNAANEGTQPNIWYVSDKESNKAVGNRGGTMCGNPTLHVGSTSAGDAGAAYDAGGCTTYGFGPCASCVTNGLWCVVSDRSAESPVISTLTYTALTISFVYIHWATLLLDNAEIIYSVDGGITWIKLADVPKSGCCSGGASCLTGCTNNATCAGSHQGKWQSYSAALPATCAGISNLKVGFRWYNDDLSGGAKDPSVAVDDITIFDPVLPVDLIDFKIEPDYNSIDVKWKAIDHGNFDHFSIERSVNGKEFTEVAQIKSTSTQNISSEFYYADKEVTGNTTYYYRLKCIDNDNSFKLSKIKTGKTFFKQSTINYTYDGTAIVVLNNELLQTYIKLEILDLTGKIILSQKINKEETSTQINSTSLNKGMYLLRCVGINQTTTIKVVVW